MQFEGSSPAIRNQTVAQQMVDVLRQAGAERIYGVVGDSLNSVVDAVRRTDGIEWVHVRNPDRRRPKP